MFKAKFERIRFSAEFGPSSLFERVQFKMRGVTDLYMDGKHFQARLSERNIPHEILSQLQHFDASKWVLRTASVRSDSGKFVDSTWEVTVNPYRYWVTIGLGNFISTIVVKDSSGIEKCVRNGEFYDYVEKVNRELMNAESNLKA